MESTLNSLSRLTTGRAPRLSRFPSPSRLVSLSQLRVTDLPLPVSWKSFCWETNKEPVCIGLRKLAAVACHILRTLSRAHWPPTLVPQLANRYLILFSRLHGSSHTPSQWGTKRRKYAVQIESTGKVLGSLKWRGTLRLKATNRLTSIYRCPSCRSTPEVVVTTKMVPTHFERKHGGVGEKKVVVVYAQESIAIRSYWQDNDESNYVADIAF